MERASVSRTTSTAEKLPSERRIAKRHACDGFAEVVVPTSGFLFRGEIADLSETGCYVKTRARLSLRRSSEAELRFTVNGDNFSVGFEFSVIEPQMHRKLLELIEELDSRDS